MAVTHDQRTLPLARNPDNPAAAGITLAWDFTGMGSLPEAQPFLYGGGSAPSLTVSGNRSYPTYNGIQGVRPGGSGASGSYSNLTFTGQGMQVGTDDFQVALIFTTGPTLPTSTNTIKALVIRNDAGTALVNLTISESNGNGWFLNANSSTGEGTAVTATIYGVNKTVILWFRRRGGVTNVWTQEATPSSILVARYNAGSDSTSWTDTSAKRIYIAWNQSTTAVVDVAIHGVRFWGGSSLDDEATRNVGRDFWALEANEVESDSLAITSPAADSAVPTTTTISGTYTGTAPTGVNVQHGSASWVTLSGFSAASGTWSGAAVLEVATAAPLRARYGNNTSIVSADVANITVEADAIAFTVPMSGADPDPMGAVDYRLFQRDGADQATGVRVTGTYDGDPEGAIEWRYNGGSWATLDETPTGGEFDETVTLQGPAQGALEVRFAANPSVSAALSYVGVGDLYLCAGQSNAAGWSPSYVQPVAPDTNPTWKAVEFDFAHVWRENFETLAKPFHIPGDAVYSAFNAGGAGDGSYYGHLATLGMASGVPIGVVPAARGSTNIDQWNAGSPTNTGTLYGAMLATAQKLSSFRYVLWWQGEGSMADTATGTAYDPTLYAGKLDEIMDAFAAAGQTAQWVLTMPCLANPTPKDNGVLLRAAIASLASNEHVAGVLDLDDPTPAYDTLHFEGSTEIITIAERMAALLGYTTSFSGGASSLIDVSAAGSGNAVESASGGASSGISVTSAGTGTAMEGAGGGANSTVDVIATGAGVAAEIANGGSASLVEVSAAGAGTAAEQAAGGASSVVEITAAGAGAAQEDGAAAGGSSSIVNVIAVGAGHAAELAEGGSSSAVAVTAVGAGVAQEDGAAAGGSASRVEVVAAGGGLATEVVVGGSPSVVAVTAAGAGVKQEEGAQQGGSASLVAVLSAGSGVALERAFGGRAAFIRVRAFGTGIADDGTQIGLPPVSCTGSHFLSASAVGAHRRAATITTIVEPIQ
ncbi:sialate O-acetylesterase [Methyloversatilis sp.]|uniref:sialate O-acetylesterase n=1 Tax=Methyloversatilis sp. TaxID=2569862 RepID=UPI003D277734